MSVATQLQDFLDVHMTNENGGCSHCEIGENEHRAGCPVGKVQNFLDKNWEELS